jgi:predicted Fe-Mo cluster-binding NifX family protein
MPQPTPGRWHFAVITSAGPAAHLQAMLDSRPVFQRAGAGTCNAGEAAMTVAIPIREKRISPLLDTAARLLVLTCHEGQEAGRREIVLAPLPPDALAVAIGEMQLDLLLCGAVSQPLLHALQQHGVNVRPHLCGELEEILQAFCHGQLDQQKFRIPGCRQFHRLPATCRRSRNKAGVR